ncbi:zinc finger protein PLAG1-like [Belonocnema kinseyi]|uniref:zinc finger protein PLAG1-like n=1 Tax=Belonocnema kinseyi TaxID=2817044 RepID=UPI00143CC273|nr:zinc finger protein PLAG1-like [Belonocnema kinseyi]
MDHQSASISLKNFKSTLKKLTGRPGGGPDSAVNCDDFLEFETVFLDNRGDEPNILPEINQLDETCITAAFGNNSDEKSLTCIIEYDHDKTLEIKEEIIHDQLTVPGQQSGKKNKSKLCITDKINAEILTVEKLRNQKKHRMQGSANEPEKEYKCEKCARSYKWRESYIRHIRFKCDVMPQFKCKICGKRFEQKSNLWRHMESVHQKSDLQISQTRHKCDQCPRSYSYIRGLNQHKRLEHAEVKPEFTCNICDYKTKRKDYLSNHIFTHHINK